MYFYLLLFNPEKEDENIHSIKYGGENILLLFQDKDDADRYSLLLEAQDFPLPSVVAVDSAEIAGVCSVEGYIAQIVPTNFLPQNLLERLMLIPPDPNTLSDQDFHPLNLYQDTDSSEIVPLNLYALPLDPDDDENDSLNTPQSTHHSPLTDSSDLPIDPNLSLFESLEIEIFRRLLEDLM